MFLEAGAAPYGGRSPPPQALPAVSPSGRKAAPPWWEDGSGLRWGDGSGLLVGEDGSGLLRTGMAAGCCGRGRQRAAADGRPAGRAAKPHTAPAGGGGAGSAPEGRRACRPYCCGAQRPARKKTRPGKPQFSGPGLVLIDSPCARSGGVFPPGSGQGRWYRRGSW